MESNHTVSHFRQFHVSRYRPNPVGRAGTARRTRADALAWGWSMRLPGRRDRPVMWRRASRSCCAWCCSNVSVPASLRGLAAHPAHATSTARHPHPAAIRRVDARRAIRHDAAIKMAEPPAEFRPTRPHHSALRVSGRDRCESTWPSPLSRLQYTYFLMMCVCR